MIKIKDLIVGEVYLQKASSYNFICMYGGEVGSKDKYIQISRANAVYYSSGSTHSDIKTLRLATPIEKKWLLMCIEAGVAVPKPAEEIINEYLIY